MTHSPQFTLTSQCWQPVSPQEMIMSPTVAWISTRANLMASVCLAQQWRMEPTHPTACHLPTPGPRRARCQGFGPWVVWKPKPWLLWEGEVLGGRSWLTPLTAAAVTTWRRRMGSIQAPRFGAMSLPFLNFSLLNIFVCDYKSIRLL